MHQSWTEVILGLFVVRTFKGAHHGRVGFWLSGLDVVGALAIGGEHRCHVALVSEAKLDLGRGILTGVPPINIVVTDKPFVSMIVIGIATRFNVLIDTGATAAEEGDKDGNSKSRHNEDRILNAEHKNEGSQVSDLVAVVKLEAVVFTGLEVPLKR